MIISLLVSWATLTLGLFIADRFLDGMKIEGGVKGTFVVSAIYGVLLFTLGGCISFGLGLASAGILFLLGFVANWIAGSILLIATDKLSDRLKLESVGTAFMASAIAAVTSSVASWAVAQMPFTS